MASWGLMNPGIISDDLIRAIYSAPQNATRTLAAGLHHCKLPSALT
jgi:hypothetical protein